MKMTIRLKLISIVSILVLVVLGLTVTQSVNAWRQRTAAVQFGSGEAAASAVLEAGSLMAVERGTTNAVLAAAQVDPALQANAARARDAAVAGLTSALAHADAAGLNTADAKAALRQLETARQTAWAAIDGNGKREPAPWFGSATRAIEAVLILAQRVGEILPSTAEARLADAFTLTGNLAEMAEYMGARARPPGGRHSRRQAPVPAFRPSFWGAPKGRSPSAGSAPRSAPPVWVRSSTRRWLPSRRRSSG